MTEGLSVHQPAVSVIMTAYNAQQYLAEAIDSILSQTCSDFELIIVNDGSTDSSGEIADSYVRRSRTIQVIHQDNSGIAAAANRGLAAARARYVARMDADDIAIEDRLAKQVSFLDANPAVLAVGGAQETFDARGPRSIVRYPTDPDQISSLLIKGQNVIANPTAMIRREAMMALRGYRPLFPVAEDCDFWLRLSELGQIANLHDIVHRYRIHAGSITRTRILTKMECGLLARASARARRRGYADPADGLSEFPEDFIERFVAAGDDRGSLEREASIAMACRALICEDIVGVRKWLPLAARTGHRGAARRTLVEHLIRGGKRCLARGRLKDGFSLLAGAFRIRPSRTLMTLASFGDRGRTPGSG